MIGSSAGKQLSRKASSSWLGLFGGFIVDPSGRRGSGWDNDTQSTTTLASSEPVSLGNGVKRLVPPAASRRVIPPSCAVFKRNERSGAYRQLAHGDLWQFYFDRHRDSWAKYLCR